MQHGHTWTPLDTHTQTQTHTHTHTHTTHTAAKRTSSHWMHFFGWLVSVVSVLAPVIPVNRFLGPHVLVVAPVIDETHKQSTHTPTLLTQADISTQADA